MDRKILYDGQANGGLFTIFVGVPKNKLAELDSAERVANYIATEVVTHLDHLLKHDPPLLLLPSQIASASAPDVFGDPEKFYAGLRGGN